MNKLTFIFLVFFTTAFVKAQVITNDSLNLEIDNKIEKVLLSKTDEIKQQIKDTEDRINKEKKIALEDLDKEINASASLFIAKVTNQSSEEIKLS